METGQQTLILDILGYLNFSSGNRDAKIFAAINSLYSIFAPISFANPPNNDKNKTNSTHNLVTVIDTNEIAKQAGTGKYSTSYSVNESTHKKSIAVHVIELLETELAELAKVNKSFRVDDQAGQVLKIVREHLLGRYRKFHEDILQHQPDNALFNSLFLAKIFEAVIRQGKPWEEVDRIVTAAIEELNDYIGYRPIAVLEGDERHEPNKHEWVAPIPLYIRGIGIAQCKYREVIEKTLLILNQTDPSVLEDACFDVNKLDELVLDPRAYDFDHPVNRKPNYHFGVWDPYVIDNDGYFRRFVIHQVTLDGILRRIEMAYLGESFDANIPMDELLYEAGAVLAGTMLMGAGVCGDTPSTFNADTNLSNLMASIAIYRDKFYEQLMDKAPPQMRERLRREETRMYQPFGHCRQSLNKQLAKRRADQLQRMNLARMFARMGYFEASKKQSDIISVASTRIMSQLDCIITKIHFLIDRNELTNAINLLPDMEDLIRRGIACGAIVDPWTILGFGANYSLFHSAENAIHDHRVDELINIMEDMFDIYSRLQKVAAITGNSEMQADMSDSMSDLAGWWDKYSSTTISGLESFSGADAWESTAIVSNALSIWCKAGTSAGDIAFWNRHVGRFNSTKAYVLVTVELLEQNDPVASMALMMHWLSNSETIPLIQGDYSFHAIAVRWMEQIWNGKKEKTNKKNADKKNADKKDVDQKSVDQNLPDESNNLDAVTLLPLSERWKLTKKFFDFIEANADLYWSVPHLDLDSGNRKNKKNNKSGKNPNKKPPNGNYNYDNLYGIENEDDEYDNEKNNKKFDDKKDSIYSAAYDNVTYQDTADDGIDGSMLELPQPGGNDMDDAPLTAETERISERIMFIATMSKLWKFVTEKIAGLYAIKTGGDAVVKASAKGGETDAEIITQLDDNFDEITSHLANWLQQIVKYDNGLDILLREVSTYEVPSPRGTADSLMEYDRHRGTKEILLDRIIWTSVDLFDAQMILKAFLGHTYWSDIREPWQIAVLTLYKEIFLGSIKDVKRCWDCALKMLSAETILYVPTSRGGAPWDIVRCRSVQQAIMRLMEYAPRLGLIVETFKLLDTIKLMEEVNTIRQGAI
ncbi:MAG: hypothetical protein LBK06_03580, partial [Planctomycetaceae bacterium]|nr:hypothetical protein [Planctomycetaceae bacterium]